MNFRQRRIAVFGGTFDPVHEGHLSIAQAAMVSLQLDRVMFVPAARNPHKQNPPIATDQQRVEMLEAVIAGNPRYGVWTGELEREGPSYAVDTVDALVRTQPNSFMLWLIGSDQLPALAKWHRIEELVARLQFICVERPDHAFEWPQIRGLRMFRVPWELHPASGTVIRQCIAAGLPITDLVPAVVEKYLQDHGIYRCGI